jgi:hypothetical protein
MGADRGFKADIEKNEEASLDESSRMVERRSFPFAAATVAIVALDENDDNRGSVSGGEK